MSADLDAQALALRALRPAPRAMTMAVDADLQAIGWDTARFPLGPIALAEQGGGMRCSGGVDVAALWRAVAGDPAGWPTLWVRTDGSNGNSGASEALALFSIEKAVQLANTSGVPTRIMVKTGLYLRGQGFSGSGGNTQPSVPIAAFAYAGRAVCAASDTFTWAADATYSWIYTTTRAGALRIVDLAARDRFGHYPDLVKLATALAVSRTPGSWALVGSTVYVNRADGLAPVDANTRLFMTVANVRHTFAAQISLLFAGETEADGFDFEGGYLAGASGGCLALAYNAASGLPTAKVMAAAIGCTFRYSGGVGGNENNCVGVLALHGLLAFERCDASKATADGFNVHNQSGGAAFGAQPALLTVGCTGFDNGRGQSISNNGWTLHEDCRGVDVAGRYSFARGSTVHIINDARALLVGTVAELSIGDVVNGGVSGPCEFRAADNAQLTLRLCTARPPSSADVAVRAEGNGRVTVSADTMLHGARRTFGAGQIGSA